MEKQHLQSLAGATFDELSSAIQAFDDEKFNAIPFQGSWTAGQVARHIVLANTGFLHLMGGAVADTDRDPATWAETIKNDFLDFNQKATSPASVTPAFKHYQQGRIIQSVSELKEKFGEAITGMDLTKTCMIFELPVYGFLTRFEALIFVIYHTKRHTQQMLNIRNILQ